MKMTIGIIGAMDEEIAVYLKFLQNIKKTEYKTLIFYEGLLFNKSVVVVKSGVGKVFAAMICQYLIDNYKVDKIIFTGVGGSLNKNAGIGDVIVGTDSVYHDFNAMPLGFKLGQISYTDYRFFKADTTLIKLALSTPSSDHKILQGRILTGDQFFTQAEKKEHTYLTEELKGDCIEMEGAAVAHVCTINEIPHVIIRTMSDNADGKAVDDYNKFTAIIAANSFKIVEHLLKRM